MFKVKLSVVDTPGFGDYINNRDSWLPVVDFIDDQHENYMRQEQQPSRQGKIDMRVHACLYFIRPNGHRYDIFFHKETKLVLTLSFCVCVCVMWVA